MKWFPPACVVFAFLLLHSGPAFSKEDTHGCNGVQIEVQSPLDFGLLRFSKSTPGKVVILPGGGITHLGGVSPSSAPSHSPASIQIMAPPAVEIYLSVETGVDRYHSTGVWVSQLKLSHMGHELARSGDFWTIRTPSLQFKSAPISITMSGTLTFNRLLRRQDFLAPINIHCELVRPIID